MNKTILYPLFLLAILAGCDERLPETNEEAALRLVSVAVDNNSQTKAALSSITQVYVYAAKEGLTEAYTTPASLVFKAETGGVWNSYKSSSSTESSDIQISAGTADIYAVYPADLVISNNNNVLQTPVTIVGNDDFTGSAQTDYLYSTDQTAGSSGRSISLLMKHALSQIAFKIIKAENVDEKMALTQLQIKSDNLLETGNGYMVLSRGAAALNNLTQTSTITLKHADQAGMTLKTSESSPNVTCLVAPLKQVEKTLSFALTIKVGEGTGAVTRTFNTSAISPQVQWKAGCRYVYTITVNKMSGSMNGVEIEDWKDDSTQDSDIGI